MGHVFGRESIFTCHRELKDRAAAAAAALLLRSYVDVQCEVFGEKMSCKSDEQPTALSLRSSGADTTLSAKRLIAQQSEGPTKYS